MRENSSHGFSPPSREPVKKRGGEAFRYDSPPGLLSLVRHEGSMVEGALLVKCFFRGIGKGQGKSGGGAGFALRGAERRQGFDSGRRDVRFRERVDLVETSERNPAEPVESKSRASQAGQGNRQRPGQRDRESRCLTQSRWWGGVADHDGTIGKCQCRGRGGEKPGAERF
jgi:hypothetical protein